jgi:hypothetical protein
MDQPLPWQDDEHGGAAAHRADGRCDDVIRTTRSGFDVYSHRLGSDGGTVRVPLGYYQLSPKPRRRRRSIVP